MRRRAALAIFLFVPSFSPAAFPTDEESRKKITDRPAELAVATPEVFLVGPRAAHQLIVTGKYSNGLVRDLTPFVAVAVEPAGVVDVQAGLFLRATKDGTATVTLSAGGKAVTVKVTVKDSASPTPPSFRHDVIATLNVGGCNMGACHGTPSGKNGFKLSLRGFDPAADFLQLTRDQFGRRTDHQHPENALLLLKGVGQVPHEGGARLGVNTLPTEMLAAWLAGGLPDDKKELPAVKGIEVLPGSRVQLNPARWQQLAVRATFTDGVQRDVTRLTNFSSSDPAVADVSPTGLVEFKRPGEVAVLARYLEEIVSVRLTYLEPRDGFKWPNPPEHNFVDSHVFAKLRQMTIAPSDLCSDNEFVRRVYLDCIGRLPTPAETGQFLSDTATTKRTGLIDRLVTLPEFADFWALKWADVLRSNRKTIQLKGSTGYQAWLRERFASNAPFNEVVKELLTATGNSYTNPPANYYRISKDPTILAESTAQLFLGVRMQCAKCHNHPFERWSQDDYYGLSAVFARVKTKPAATAADRAPKPAESAEVVLVERGGEVSQPRTGKTMKPRFPGKGDQDLPPGTDRRAAFADWLTAVDNPFFAKSVVNRVWFHLMGRGIVDPVDDFRESNPSANDELLNALAADFAKNGYDLRRLVTTVLKSRTYQLSALPNDTNRDDVKYFSRAVTKLLTAEQLLDALCDFTGVPEKFTGLPAGTRAIQLPDGEVNHPFLKTFGQPARELACECERESDGNLAQALQLINGPTVNEKVKNPDNRVGKLLAAKKSEGEILTELYAVALSRQPDAEETKVALTHVAKTADKRKAWEDVMWAILNTREFLFRH
ncbi:MAG: DUF1549 and DUF1553 domain-containing protein [Fimbriiglobus sp.]|nr:DUF1549 and DUF1553 domain-containing protein [Fimbriiglobus sp.]